MQPNELKDLILKLFPVGDNCPDPDSEVNRQKRKSQQIVIPGKQKQADDQMKNLKNQHIQQFLLPEKITKTTKTDQAPDYKNPESGHAIRISDFIGPPAVKQNNKKFGNNEFSFSFHGFRLTKNSKKNNCLKYKLLCLKIIKYISIVL